MGKQPAALRHSRALSLSEKLLRPYAAALVTGPAGRVRQTANRRLTGPWLQSATAELNLRNCPGFGAVYHSILVVIPESRR